ncbi:NCS1 nucleoside transporter protein [Rutstroemia sp. NJR-2017a BBW]|nr:NCS1 nucleoside transporter protein [Rutstroemia sp. NJR-2017a BBW]
MTLFQRVRNTLRNPHLKARRADVVRVSDGWLDSDDIRPLRLADRTWDVWTYLTFWFSATSTVSTWYAASSAQALGLSMWESIICAFAGQCLVALIIVLNGRAGAKYHMAAFGVFGAWWPTFNRAVMAIVWNGVNAVQGGECFYVMLHALSPNVASFKNIMGSGSALDSGGMLGLGIFWLLTCCFLIIPVPRFLIADSR